MSQGMIRFSLLLLFQQCFNITLSKYKPRVLFSAYFITLSSKENTTAEFGGKRLKPNFTMSSKRREYGAIDGK